MFVGRLQATVVPKPFGSSLVQLSVLPASLWTMAARRVLDVNRSPEPFVCFVSALGVKEADGPLVTVVPYTFDHPNRRLIFVEVSSLEDLAAEPFLRFDSRRTVRIALRCWAGVRFAVQHSCSRPATPMWIDVAASRTLRGWRCVPCLSLTGLTSSVHLGIPKLGGRWPDASDIFFMCFVLGCFT